VNQPRLVLQFRVDRRQINIPHGDAATLTDLLYEMGERGISGAHSARARMEYLLDGQVTARPVEWIAEEKMHSPAPSTNGWTATEWQRSHL